MCSDIRDITDHRSKENQAPSQIRLQSSRSHSRWCIRATRPVDWHVEYEPERSEQAQRSRLLVGGWLVNGRCLSADDKPSIARRHAARHGTETFVKNYLAHSGTSFGVGKRGSAVVTKVRLSLSCRTRGNFFEQNDVCDSSITPACETS